MKKISNVLLIDDDDISNFLTTTVIKSTNLVNHIEVCNNGFAVLTYLKNHLESTGTVPDLILLDLDMPEIDGIDFLKAYRETINYVKASVIIILSTSENLRDSEKVKKYPEVEVHLNKPLKKECFQFIIDKYFS